MVTLILPGQRGLAQHNVPLLVVHAVRHGMAWESDGQPIYEADIQKDFGTCNATDKGMNALSYYCTHLFPATCVG